MAAAVRVRAEERDGEAGAAAAARRRGPGAEAARDVTASVDANFLSWSDLHTPRQP